MKKFIGVMLFMLAFAVGASAQSSGAPITVAVGPTNCGRTSVPYVCFRVPVTVYGTSITQMQIGQSQIFFYDANNSVVEVVHIDNEQVTARNNLYQPTQIVFSFTSMGAPYTSDPDNNGDNDVVMGGFTLNINWYHGGYGRNAGWYSQVVGGSGSQSIVQD
jgi:hypothetical protein